MLCRLKSWKCFKVDGVYYTVFLFMHKGEPIARVFKGDDVDNRFFTEFENSEFFLHEDGSIARCLTFDVFTPPA